MDGPNFIPGEVYRRRELHAAWGGSQQSGISFSKRAPVIFLFTGASGESYGYRDGWQPDGSYHYTGEGQLGDMAFTRGNAAIRSHEEDGRRLFLFQKVARPSGMVRFLGEVRLRSWRYVDGVPDREGHLRRVIVFDLEPVDRAVHVREDADDYDADLPPTTAMEAELQRIQAMRQALEALPSSDGTRSAMPGQPERTEAQRSGAVRTLVLRRARGLCEGCGEPAPFEWLDGSAYLEVHALDMGPDRELRHPATVAALCPNCHRRVHHGIDGPAWNEMIHQRVQARET